jgi:hypothetical protein
VLLVELEQLHHVRQALYRVLEMLVHQHLNVELLVTPIDFQDGLEAGQEVVGLFVGAVNDGVDSGIFGLVEFLVADPGDRVQCERLLVRLFHFSPSMSSHS